MSDEANEGEERSSSDDDRLKNQYEIRILADGRVVFGDLPEGLSEVAQIVAGSEPRRAGGSTPSTSAEDRDS